LSVCLSRLYIVSKRVIAFFTIWNSHTIVVFPHQMSWQYSLNAGGVSTNRNSGRIAGYRSMTAGRASNNCDGRPCSLSHRQRRISGYLYITAFSMDEYAEEKRAEQNLIVRSGKSEAEVTNNKRRRSRYSTAEANYRQRRSIARPVCDSTATYFYNYTPPFIVNVVFSKWHLTSKTYGHKYRTALRDRSSLHFVVQFLAAGPSRTSYATVADVGQSSVRLLSVPWSYL